MTENTVRDYINKAILGRFFIYPSDCSFDDEENLMFAKDSARRVYQILDVLPAKVDCGDNPHIYYSGIKVRFLSSGRERILDLRSQIENNSIEAKSDDIQRAYKLKERLEDIPINWYHND